MSKETWTPADEAKLAELEDRKERVMRERRLPVLAFVRELPTVHSIDEDDVVDWLIQHADTLRDLLQPFDSGVRPAEPQP